MDVKGLSFMFPLSPSQVFRVKPKRYSPFPEQSVTSALFRKWNTRHCKTTFCWAAYFEIRPDLEPGWWAIVLEADEGKTRLRISSGWGNPRRALRHLTLWAAPLQFPLKLWSKRPQVCGTSLAAASLWSFRFRRKQVKSADSGASLPRRPPCRLDLGGN